MKSKRGNMPLGETIVKVGIAIIGITVLLILALNLYSIFLIKPKIDQAKATMDDIILKIEGLEDSDSTDYIVESPKGWHFFEFNKDGQDNFCICPKANEKNCLIKGICKDIKVEVVGNSIKVDKAPIGINIDKDGEGKVSIKKTSEDIEDAETFEFTLDSRLKDVTYDQLADASFSLSSTRFTGTNTGQQVLFSSRCLDYFDLAKSSSEKYGIPDPVLLLAIMQAESSCNPVEVGSTPDYGLMQITPIAIKDSCPELVNKDENIILAPIRNVDCGSKHLVKMFNRWN
ncbi:MAG: transglycosylase SLT domain-containing protein, partial [Candidatus Nanoarchaeia archaeon]